MINSWSLLYDELYGDDEMTDENKITPQESDEYDPIIGSGSTVSLSNGITISGLQDGVTMGDEHSTTVHIDGFHDVNHSDYWFDYTRNDPNAENPFIDSKDRERADQVKSSIRDESQKSKDCRYKYHEHQILNDNEEYVSRTYNGHYTGTKFEYRNVQTLDLMAARDLASDFCQANILKYGSRYGSKDGKNKKDLMKVIHYAMLLLHFDEHYGKPSQTSGNIDHNMP